MCVREREREILWISSKKQRGKKKKQYIEEKKKRDEERKLRALENAPLPYYREITVREQLVAYLTEFTAPTLPASSRRRAKTTAKSIRCSPAWAGRLGRGRRGAEEGTRRPAGVTHDL